MSTLTDHNETDVSEVVAELVAVVSEENNSERIAQHETAGAIPNDQDAEQVSTESKAGGTDEADVIEIDACDEADQSPSSDDQGSCAVVDGNGNEATLTSSGMANMITDASVSESTTEESTAAKDNTNAAFEDFLERSTAAKTEATEAYKQSDLATARLKYMTALELLQNVQGDLSNKQKSTLFEQTVACNNNVALCCMGLDDHANCVAFATNSLLLIRSLERNIPDGMIWKCLTENGVTLDQLKKVWKKKALYYVGKAQLKRKNFKEAAEHLEEALGLIAEDAKLAANAGELRTLLADAKARYAKEMKREKSTWAKAFKKGKTEVESMYRDVAEPASPAPSAPNSPMGANVQNFDPNNLKFDLSDLDINKKKKKKAESTAVAVPFMSTPFGMFFGVAFLSAVVGGTFWWIRNKRR